MYECHMQDQLEHGKTNGNPAWEIFTFISLLKIVEKWRVPLTYFFYANMSMF